MTLHKEKYKTNVLGVLSFSFIIINNNQVVANVTPVSSINTLRPRQIGRHFPDDIFKHVFLNEHCFILMKISLKSVAQGPINNIPALVQIMAWRRSGDKTLSEPMMVYLNDAYMRHSASMS